MNRRSLSRRLFNLAVIAIVAANPVMQSLSLQAAELQSATLKAWDAYVQATERRIATELSSSKGFLALDFQPPADRQGERQAVLAGQIPVRKMQTPPSAGVSVEIIGGMIHHWRGTVFVPGAKLDQILARVINPAVQDMRQEDVLESAVLERGPDSLRIFLKLQRSKIITVVYNTEHKVRIRRHGEHRASSTSVATRIAELEKPNSNFEREKPVGQDRGFLWKLNSYWRYEETPKGVIVECESISLSRTVPSLLESMIRPMIENTARESMARTLASMRGRMASSISTGY